LRSEIQEAAHALDDLPVLILGEPGTGKTLVARTLHDISSRRAGRFESVDCSSISPSLFESEVFGHEKGAFTGAITSLPGRFELAHRGTLFLDEVGDFPMEQQPKLLVALQEHRVRRLGAKSDVTVDIAVIAATNHDLPRMVAEGRFRADLYDRINGVTIHVPPLRDRPDDLGVLVDQFARAAAERRDMTILDVDSEILAIFRVFDWPGNVRQLYQVVQRMVGRAKGNRLTIDLVPEHIRTPHPRTSGRAGEAVMLSKERIEVALAEHEGNVRRTAASLGLSRSRLYRLMEKYRITPPR
jgi:transcriptional regulator with GAF, ATPase, and Fis domain